MIAASRSSVYWKAQESRDAFCCISSADVATPPALAALPGAKATPASRSTLIAAGVVGMFAPSATTLTPFFTSAVAALSSSSFSVADGKATSQGTSQIDPSAVKLAWEWASTYSLTRPRCTCLMSSRTSRSMPLESTM